jgi:signal transduction histidine kinase
MAATVMALTAALLLRGGRRRTAINEALHELRRPLQALALSEGSVGSPGRVETSTRLAAAALERLDREVNGAAALRRPAAWPERVSWEEVLRAAVDRWGPRALGAGGSLELRWRAGEGTIVGDRDALERAVDNLVVNAIEHGGPDVVVEGELVGGRLLVSVLDSGGRERSGAERARRSGRRPAGLSRLTGRRRRGHGLAIVRRTAAAHGGRFLLRSGDGGTRAVLELGPGVVGPPPAGA